MAGPKEQMSWIDILMSGIEELESPERYFWWSGLAAIAAATKKQVYLNRGGAYKLYPNIYVALVSSKSGMKKGLPIAMIKSLLEDSEITRVISGCTSIQGLIQELSHQKTFPNGLVINKAQGILISGEFDSFLIEDPKALTQLTELHNTHEHEKFWEKRLKGGAPERLNEPCLTLLVASNETLWNSVVKQKDFQGGFVARTFIVYESQVRRYNPLTEEVEGERIDRSELVRRLRTISKLTGQFRYSSQSKEVFNAWYLKNAPIHDNMDDPSGTLNRLGDKILKVAMLLSLARGDSLVMSELDMLMAISKSEECLSAVQVVSPTDSVDIGAATMKVLKLLLNSPDRTVTRKSILGKLQFQGVDPLILDRVIESLLESGGIIEPFRNARKEIVYKATKEIWNQYRGK